LEKSIKNDIEPMLPEASTLTHNAQHFSRQTVLVNKILDACVKSILGPEKS
jgi:hypothetical protein